MDVSIIGASGDCGREIVTQLLVARVISPSERLQLVGRAEGRSAQILVGLCSDLEDAYAEMAPELDVALHPEEVVGDVIVMAAGATVGGKVTSRAELAQVNLPLFESYAKAIARYGHGHEVIIVVTNPVELAVEVFSRYLDRHQVIGIGAYSDSLRFRREIAADVGIRRQLVQGFVVGEHGDSLVPLWSSVQVQGMDTEELQTTLKRLRRGRLIDDFPNEVNREKQIVLNYLQNESVQAAYTYVDRLPPDLRVVIKPYVTHLSGAKTISATANVTVDLVKTLLDGKEIVVSGQVQLEGEFYGIQTPIGVPIVVTPFGWTQVVPLQLWEEEAQLLKRQADRLKRRLKEDWQHD
ncbi:malate dehydrogenase [Oscillatoria sp. FACHB-1407]|uniref:malate dehydrogenase n=1 Tax=Oscillatoria sp. FACHB-1407 TaxID=2692847 RepID=UPI001687E983|nr:malate dehydrogenase [Oscillatoria sp. FACHB-1407]MBD2462564.1 malate dehydrogenase [Oscillatoria sp. FACHB-1407]